MNDNVSLAKVLLLEYYWHKLVLWLRYVAKSKFGSRLYLPIWNGVIYTVLLCVERLFSLLLLLILVLGVEAIKEHEVNLHDHFLLFGARFTIEFDPVVTDIVEFYFLLTKLNEESLRVEGWMGINDASRSKHMSLIEFGLVLGGLLLLLVLWVCLVVFAQYVGVGIGSKILLMLTLIITGSLLGASWYIWKRRK